MDGVRCAADILAKAATAALAATLVAAPGAAQQPRSVPSGSLVEVVDDATRAAATGVDFTGRWEGDMLTIKTTHLKEGYVRRNGLPRSDMATLTEHWLLHGDVLTVATIVSDPVYLTEPFIRTTDYELDLHQQNPPYPCEVVEEVDRPKGAVPHRIPGGDD